MGAFFLSKEYDVPIVGGDTTRWGFPLAIDVAILRAERQLRRQRDKVLDHRPRIRETETAPAE